MTDARCSTTATARLKPKAKRTLKMAAPEARMHTERGKCRNPVAKTTRTVAKELICSAVNGER